MKKIIATLFACLTITSAHATVFATMPNASGGRIELSDVKAPAELQRYAGCKSGYIAKSWGDGADDIFGCWIQVGDTVSVVWPAGNRTYPISAFTLTKEGQAVADKLK
jgi:hypothetical protein